MRFRVRVNIFFEKDFEMVVKMKFEYGMTNTGILGIVVRKLSHWQQLHLIILLPIDTCSKIRFHRTILSLGLNICLGIEGCI